MSEKEEKRWDEEVRREKRRLNEKIKEMRETFGHLNQKNTANLTLRIWEEEIRQGRKGRHKMRQHEALRYLERTKKGQGKI